MPCRTLRLSGLALAIAMASTAASASAASFNRLHSFSTADNLPASERAQQTSAEIITATASGEMLIYSDSPRGGIGYIALEKDGTPRAAGFTALAGEPTAVSAVGEDAVVGVNTSTSFTEPSGFLALVSGATQQVLGRCDLGGQPDSVAVSHQGDWVAVAIENERDEDLNDGEIPQLPAGDLVLVPLSEGALDCEGLKRVELTGLAEIAPSDPEPEFVDFNALGEVVVTL